MIDQQWLDVNGAEIVLDAPFTGLADRAARLDQRGDALTALAPVMRPLVIEVQLCWRELQTGLPAYVPSPGRRRFAVAGAVPRVAVRPFWSDPPPLETVETIDRDLIASCLTGAAPPGPDLQEDWLEVNSTAMAVSAFEPFDAIKVDLLEAPVPPYEPSWFAGPISNAGEGYEYVAPAQLTLRSEGRVTLKLAVHWSRWLHQMTPEREAVLAGLSRLVDKGWTEETEALVQ